MSLRLLILLGCVYVSLQVGPLGLIEDDPSKRADWGYTAANGPDTWAANFPEFCAGIGQSPINYEPAKMMRPSVDPGPIQMVGWNMPLMGNITNSGYTLVYNPTGGVKPYATGGRLGNDVYEFLQMHWHWGSDSSQGSEHTVDGKMYPLELHMVHINKRKYGDNWASYPDGAAVLGFFYEVADTDNMALGNLLSSVGRMLDYRRSLKKKSRGKKGGKKARAGETFVVSTDIKLNDMIPAAGVGDTYYYYSGGLTTPACNEIVQWTSFVNTVPVSEAQLNRLRSLTNSDGQTFNNNYRPPQPLNGRSVFIRTVGTGIDPAAGGAVVGAAGAGLGAGLGAGTLNGIIIGAGAAFLINALLGSSPQDTYAKVARTSQSGFKKELSEAEKLLRAGQKLFG